MSRAGPPESSPFRYVHSASFPALLRGLGSSLVVTTYQAGKLMVVRAEGDKLSMLLRTFEKPMGLALSSDQRRVVVGTRRMVWTLRAEPEIAPQLEPKGRHDSCFVPRAAHVTGDMHVHDVAVVGDRIWLVNTLFSCLCTIDDERYSFVPRWKPPFIDRLAAEDRCHLNGLAVENDEIAYVTALGCTNTAAGWRDRKVDGGVVLSVASGEVVTSGLCMPHSPRMHDGELFVLDSGRGLLCAVDVRSGARTTVAALPGYTRGLAFAGRIAFVGLSKIREKDFFGGLPVAAEFGEGERRCGVVAVDLQSGKTIGFLWIEAGCEELFDIRVLVGMRFPTVVGFQGDLLDGIMLAPEAAWRPGPLPSAADD